MYVNSITNTEANETAESKRVVGHDNYDIDMADVETGYYFSIYLFRMCFPSMVILVPLKFRFLCCEGYTCAKFRVTKITLINQIP